MKDGDQSGVSQSTKALSGIYDARLLAINPAESFMSGQGGSRRVVSNAKTR